MTIPGRTVNLNAADPTPFDSASQTALDDFQPSHHNPHTFIGDPSHPLAVAEAPDLRVPDPADLASTEKTRAAWLQLADSPRDTFALAVLWDENRPSVEHEMHLHLHSDSNSPLRQKLLAQLVWHARFFCNEVDDPKAWVARCANLEARRLALQLIGTR